MDKRIKQGIFYDLQSETQAAEIKTTDNTDSFVSVASVQEAAGAAKGIKAVPFSVEPFTAKSAHEVFKSLINASTCANDLIAQKPDGFYIITPSSFYELC